MNSKIIINGHTVSYDESVKLGIYYLTKQLNSQEVQVYFDQAFSHGFAFFEDQKGFDYKLIHNGAEYQLIKA